MNRRAGDLHIAPCLKLAMLIWGETAEKPRVGYAQKPVMRLVLAKDGRMLLPRVRLTPVPSSERDRLLGHLVRRRERLESWGSTLARGSALSGQRGDNAGTLPKQISEQRSVAILKRFQSPQTLVEQENSSQRAKRLGAEPEPLPIIRGSKQGQPEAALDVNHLAERVIQAIDRRIIAQRERLGRV